MTDEGRVQVGIAGAMDHAMQTLEMLFPDDPRVEHDAEGYWLEAASITNAVARRDGPAAAAAIDAFLATARLMLMPAFGSAGQVRRDDRLRNYNLPAAFRIGHAMLSSGPAPVTADDQHLASKIARYATEDPQIALAVSYATSDSPIEWRKAAETIERHPTHGIRLRELLARITNPSLPNHTDLSQRFFDTPASFKYAGLHAAHAANPPQEPKSEGLTLGEARTVIQVALRDWVRMMP
jgi:hypothetical protein